MGIALGSGIDARPLDVLFGSPVGAWCLLIGTALAASGLLWVERLADGAMR
jgi:tight adherence protein B